MATALPRLQLDLFEAPPHPRDGRREGGREHSSITVTRALRAHRSCNRVLERVRYVRRFFPELDGVTLRVGLTRAASGMAIMGGNEIWLNPGRPSYHTIAHELVHLLQKRDPSIPQGERACDLHSLARDWTLNDIAPSYVRVPPSMLLPDAGLKPDAARLVCHVATEAVARRRDGLRTYISWFEKRLRELSGRENGARGC